MTLSITFARKLFLALFFLPLLTFAAPPDSTSGPKISIGGFVDVYYLYDFNQPETRQRLPFLFNHNRHNEIGINLAIVSLSIQHTRYRVNVALHSGSYVEDTYAAEPDLLKFVRDARVGVALDNQAKWWFDAGIFGGSHTGDESALSVLNPTLTRSLIDENSPYYMAGARLSWQANPTWWFAVLALNGFQRIARVEGNSLPAFGTQIVVTPDESVTLQWSTLIGTDDPDSTRRMRYFSNFYAQFRLSKRLSALADFDIGWQQVALGSTDYNLWFGTSASLRYQVSGPFGVAIRGEYYHDPDRVITGDFPTAMTQYQVYAASLNFDYVVMDMVWCRLEGRYLGNADPIFPRDGQVVSNNFSLIGSVAIKFGEVE